jgi:hypothetical protein
MNDQRSEDAERAWLEFGGAICFHYNVKAEGATGHVCRFQVLLLMVFFLGASTSKPLSAGSTAQKLHGGRVSSEAIVVAVVQHNCPVLLSSSSPSLHRTPVLA